MINNRFLRIQLKRIWIPTLVIGLVVGGFVGVALGGNYLVPYYSTYTIHHGNSTRTEGGGYHNNALNISMYYRSILFAFLVVYVISSSITLLLIEQERGYVSSWLTSPMSRWTIFATKFLAMIIGLLIIQSFALLLQLILNAALMHDFDKYVGYIFLSHLDIAVGIFFTASLVWFIGSWFNRQWIPLLIISLVLMWCGIATALGEVGHSLGVKWMKNMYYFSLFSLIHTPFERFVNPEFSSGGGISNGWTLTFGEILPIKASDYAWQIPVMALLGVGLFVWSQFILKNKDYNV